MGFDRKGRLVSWVAPGAPGHWIVMENEFNKPLASFDGQNDARKYADDLAKTNNGSTVMVFDQTS
jgi:hypothetical protein